MLLGGGSHGGFYPVVNIVSYYNDIDEKYNNGHNSGMIVVRVELLCDCISGQLHRRNCI